VQQSFEQLREEEEQIKKLDHLAELAQGLLDSD